MSERETTTGGVRLRNGTANSANNSSIGAGAAMATAGTLLDSGHTDRTSNDITEDLVSSRDDAGLVTIR